MGLCWARARHSLKVARLPVVWQEGCSFQHSTDRQTDAGRADRCWKGRRTLEGQAHARRAGTPQGCLDYKGKGLFSKLNSCSTSSQQKQ